MGLQYPRHDFPDVGKSDAPLEKRGHSDLVRRVEHSGERPARFSGGAREIQRGKIRAPGSLEIKARKGRKIERLERVRNPVRPRHRIMNWKAHVGARQLREHGSIDKLHHRMHHALRVDDDIDARHFHIEKPPGLDHLEPFVEQRGGVYGDLRAHVPRRVLQRLRPRHAGELFRRHFPERAARRRQD